MNDLIIIDNLLHSMVCDMMVIDLNKEGWKPPEKGGDERDEYVDKIKQHTEIRGNKKDTKSSEHSARIRTQVLASKVVNLVAQPWSVRYFQFNHYSKGQNYNWHNDASHMHRLRTDYTVVIGLVDEKLYEGGDHVFMHGSGEESVRVKKGQCLMYPSGILHKVTPVTKGTRIVAISWMQSLIKNPCHRAMITEAKQVVEYAGKLKRYSKAHLHAISLENNLRREFAG